jgi:hypothetical protein
VLPLDAVPKEIIRALGGVAAPGFCLAAGLRGSCGLNPVEHR